MHRIMSLAFVVLGVGLMHTTLRAENDDLTSSDMRRLSEQEANRQVHRDLDSILLPSGRYPVGNRLEVGEHWISTRSYGSPVEGVCIKDTLSLLYAQSEPGKPSPRRTMRPYGIESFRNYALARKPEVSMLKDSDEKSDIFRAECRATSLKRVRNWIIAPDPLFLVQSWLAYDAAVARLRAGSLSPKACNIGSAFVKRDCLTSIFERQDYTCPPSAPMAQI